MQINKKNVTADMLTACGLPLITTGTGKTDDAASLCRLLLKERGYDVRKTWMPYKKDHPLLPTLEAFSGAAFCESKKRALLVMDFDEAYPSGVVQSGHDIMRFRDRILTICFAKKDLPEDQIMIEDLRSDYAKDIT